MPSSDADLAAGEARLVADRANRPARRRGSSETEEEEALGWRAGISRKWQTEIE